MMERCGLVEKLACTFAARTLDRSGKYVHNGEWASGRTHPPSTLDLLRRIDGSVSPKGTRRECHFLLGNCSWDAARMISSFFSIESRRASISSFRCFLVSTAIALNSLAAVLASITITD